jgi:hypothetical protein
METAHLKKACCFIQHNGLFPHTQASQYDVNRTQGNQASLHVPLQKFAMEITSDGVVDEPFRSLDLSACLILEYHIIIPPAKHTCRAG